MKILAIMILLLPLLLLSGCGSDPLSPTFTVRYEVTGSAESVNIDCLDESGDLVIINGQQLPWEMTFSGDEGDQVFLSAVRIGDTGTVTVKIFRNGSLLSEDTSDDGTAAEAEGTL